MVASYTQMTDVLQAEIISFNDRVHMACEEIDTLSQCFSNRVTIEGDAKYIKNMYGSYETKVMPEAYENKFDDVEYSSINLEQREIKMAHLYIADMITDLEIQKAKFDPTNAMTLKMARAFGVKRAKVILNSMTAPVNLYNDTTPRTLDPTFIIDNSAVTLTEEMFKDAFEQITNSGAYSVTEKPLALFGANVNRQMLGWDKITSSDYVKTQVIQNGNFNNVDVYGFKCIMSTNVPANKILFVLPSQIVLGGNGQDFTGIDRISTKHYNTQIYTRMHFGAVRMDDKAVIDMTIKTV